MPCRLRLLDTGEIKTYLEKGSVTTTDHNGIFFPFTCGYIVFIKALQY